MGNCILTSRNTFNIELVGTNPNPSADFVAQTVGLNLSKYKGVIIQCGTDSHAGRVFCLMGQGAVCYEGYVNNNVPIRVREATISTSGIYFSAGSYTTEGRADLCIPQKIGGVEG